MACRVSPAAISSYPHQNRLTRSADMQVFADHLLEEHAAGYRPVQNLSQRKLRLEEGNLVAVARPCDPSPHMVAAATAATSAIRCRSSPRCSLRKWLAAACSPLGLSQLKNPHFSNASWYAHFGPGTTPILRDRLPLRRLNHWL